MTRTTTVEPALGPRRVGRFRILETLGPGAYAAQDPAEDRVVRLELWADSGEDTDKRLESARSITQLRHPNVVSVLEIGEHERGLFIAEEPVRGEGLPSVLRRRRLPLDERVALFAGIARGLQAAHEVTRSALDFAPHHVVVAPDTQPLLSLRGRREDTLPAARYMSPEQIAGRPLTPASDQFSFGVALYEALFCRHPFVHTDVASLHAAVLGGRIVPCDGRGVSASLERVVMRCLQSNPRARFESMEHVAEALEGGNRSASSLLAVAVLTAFGLAVAACVQLA